MSHVGQKPNTWKIPKHEIFAYLRITSSGQTYGILEYDGMPHIILSMYQLIFYNYITNGWQFWLFLLWKIYKMIYSRFSSNQ